MGVLRSSPAPLGAHGVRAAAVLFLVLLLVLSATLTWSLGSCKERIESLESDLASATTSLARGIRERTQKMRTPLQTNKVVIDRPFGCTMLAGRSPTCHLSPTHESVPAVFLLFRNVSIAKAEKVNVPQSQGLGGKRACPAWLAFNLRAAREATPHVIFIEEGTVCKRVCDTFRIKHISFSYKDYEDELEILLQKWHTRHPDARAEFLLSFLRYRVLARVAQQEPSMKRFIYLDIDMYIRTDVRYTSQYFEDFDVGFSADFPLGNAIYSLFTRESIADFADFVRSGYSFTNPKTNNVENFGDDMVAVKSYALYHVPDEEHECTHAWPGPSALRTYGTCSAYVTVIRPPHTPKFRRVANFADPFLGGEVLVEFWTNHPGYFKMHSTGPRSRVLQWRDGDLVQLRTTTRRSPPLHALHFQGGAKHCILFALRLFNTNKATACQRAIREDCACDHMCCHGCAKRVFEACNVTTRYFDVPDHLSAPYEGPWNFDLRD